MALVDNPKILKRIKELVEHHIHNQDNPLLLACWYNLNEERDIYLLEVAEDVADSGDGTLDTFTFGMSRELGIPGALRVTYTSPEELRYAAQKADAPGHPLLERIRTAGCLVLFGEDSPLADEVLRNARS
ncbi:hypothetical protein FJZ31_31705 [Candidatus Poribacteria bacterium]|nr:hypothetical protein [Candidatus Poribacteria bacterium]